MLPSSARRFTSPFVTRRWFTNPPGNSPFPAGNNIGNFESLSTKILNMRIWHRMAEDMDRRKKGEVPPEWVRDGVPYKFVTKTRKDGEALFDLAFTTDHQLHQAYANHYGMMRVGKILEDMDAVCGSVAYRHCDDVTLDTPPPTIVTASIDRLVLLNRLSLEKNVRLKGYVGSVGKSSMEIHVEMTSYDGDSNNPKNILPLISANFTMVARDPFKNKAIPINRLIPTNPQEELDFQQGEDHQRIRKQRIKESLQPPPPSELEFVHKLFLSENSTPKFFASSSLHHPNAIKMGQTRMSSIRVCHPQQRNVHGKIFGGYLLRTGFELAWATAFVFSQSRPFFLCMDDVSFVRPVEIGSILSLNSVITYVSEINRTFCCTVNASVIDPTKGTIETTNLFHFTFTCPDKELDGKAAPPLRQVLPESYSDAILHVEGKKRYLRGKETAHKLNSGLAPYW
eukprot:TRINITY_DN3389_c0_g1_i2.p1 TRINITY_DN3389_c0_g1~~TRINITY_DN3389_c0_g1_i2.p1  ORF type:complete len:454 (+),score=99.25 TRINITY_DN3389_c0_g1_i2:130-1491(+)